MTNKRLGCDSSTSSCLGHCCSNTDINPCCTWPSAFNPMNVSTVVGVGYLITDQLPTSAIIIMLSHNFVFSVKLVLDISNLALLLNVRTQQKKNKIAGAGPLSSSSCALL